MSKFKKYDNGKLEYSLLDRFAVEEIIKVLMYGAHDKGYGSDNWHNCEDPMRYWNACMRHLMSAREKQLDDESGLYHLAHAGCCIQFMLGLINIENKKKKCEDS